MATASATGATAPPTSPFKHVFVLMLENHSFDNLLAFSGIPGLIAATPKNSNTYFPAAGLPPTTYSVQDGAPDNMPTDPGHEFNDVLMQLGGQNHKPYSPGNYPAVDNSGFAASYATTLSEGTGLPPAAEVGDIMKGFDTCTELPALYSLAINFAVCDQWFASIPGPTWPNRFFLHGASSNGFDHSPSFLDTLKWESIGGFQYPHGSLFDRMNQTGVTWRLYHDATGPLEGRIPQVASLHNVNLLEVHSLDTLQSDLAGGFPYQYAFIEPNYGDSAKTFEDGSSQHPMDGMAKGDGLIKKLYEMIRASSVWDSSLLIITYDEHGGFYDHYPPGPATPPSDGSQTGPPYNVSGFTFDHFGVRVPAVVVSAYTPKGADHTVYDHSSVSSTVGRLFGMAPLTARDTAANPIASAVAPGPLRTDCPMTLPAAPVAPARPAPTAEALAASELQPVPDNSSLVGVLGVLLKADSRLSASNEERQAAIAKFKAIKTRGDARAYMHDIVGKVDAEKARRAALIPGSTTPLTAASS